MRVVHVSRYLNVLSMHVCMYDVHVQLSYDLYTDWRPKRIGYVRVRGPAVAEGEPHTSRTNIRYKHTNCTATRGELAEEGDEEPSSLSVGSN